jgi:hypothetical protein
MLVSLSMCALTPGSPGKFLLAAFVRPHAQKVTAEIYPLQLIVRATAHLKNSFPSIFPDLASSSQRKEEKEFATRGTTEIIL